MQIDEIVPEDVRPGPDHPRPDLMADFDGEEIEGPELCVVSRVLLLGSCEPGFDLCGSME